MLEAEMSLAQLEDRRRERRERMKSETAQNAAKQRAVTELRRMGRHQEADWVESGIIGADEIPGLFQTQAPEEPKVVTLGDRGNAVWDPETRTFKPVPLSEDWAAMPEAPTGPEPKDRVTMANTMVGNYWKEVKEPMEVIERWRDVSKYVPGKLDGAQQRVLVVNFAKALDPSSAVMENEADAIAQAARKLPGLDRWYRAAVDSSLPEEDQRNILREITKLAARRYPQIEGARQRYGKQFELAGIDDPSPYLGYMPDPPSGFDVLPPGIPEGSVKGTDARTGKTVYKTPDGRILEP
jgi:hypothetical protein